MKKYSITIYGSYRFDVILLIGENKEDALYRFKNFITLNINNAKLRSHYSSINDSLLEDGIEFLDEYVENDLHELIDEFMIIEKFEE